MVRDVFLPPPGEGFFVLPGNHLPGDRFTLSPRDLSI